MILNDNMIPLIVVGIFLLITLIIGLYAGKGIKTFKDYALGKGRFSSFSIAFTFFATWIGGQSIIGETNTVREFGILALMAWFATSLRLVFTGLLFSNKLSRFSNIGNIYTPGDLIEKFYGTKIKRLVGIISYIKFTSYVSVQFILLGKIINYFFHINEYWGIIIGGVLLSIYSILGGINSVTKTDIFQFFILIIVLPIIAGTLIHKIGSYKEIFIKVSVHKFAIKSNTYWLTLIFYITFILSDIYNPTILQRGLIAKDAKQIKFQFFTLALLNIVIGIFITIIGLSIFVLFPKMNEKEIFLGMVNEIYSSGLLKGLIISGLLAVIMSTADSYLHSVSLIFFRDIFNLHIRLKEAKILLGIKFATLFASIFTMFLALFLNENFYYVGIARMGSLIAFPLVLFPYLAGILGIKTDVRSFFLGAVAGLLASVGMLKLFPDLKPLVITISVLANAVAYMISHIIQNKGIRWTKSKEQEDKLWFPSPQKISSSIANFIPTPKKILLYSRSQVTKYGSYNIVFGIYCVINFTLPYFLWENTDEVKYNMMTYLRIVGGMFATLLIAKDAWKDFFKPYYPIFWHTALIYCLPFITTVMFLLTNGSFVWLMNIGVSIFFLVMLVAGEMFLILYPIGVILGLAFYKYFVGSINLSSFGFDIKYYLAYQLVFPTIIALLFAYRKKLFYMVRSNQGINLGLSMGHELKNTGLNVLPCSQVSGMFINNAKEKNVDGIDGYFLDKKSFGVIKDNNDVMHDLGQQMLRIVKNFEQFMIEYKSSLANPQLCSLKGLVEETIDQYHFGPGQREKVKLELSQDFRIKVPRKIFIFVIDNIIRNAFKHGNPNKIDIWIENDELHIRDDGKGIPSNKLSDIFKLHYTTGDNTSSGIGLAFVKQIIETANGEIWCNSQTGEGSYTEFTIKFPAIFMDVSEEEQQEALIEEIEKKQARLIAKNLLRQGVDKDMICRSTGLSKKEIDGL